MQALVSPIFYRNYHSKADIVCHQGGTRSGKTYSILQTNVFKWCLQHTGLIIDIVRKTQTEIRDTLLPDWEEILLSEFGEGHENLTVYDITEHKSTYLQYRINGNLVRFIGLDKAQKKRGAKRHILYINEANGLTLEDWTQLSIRTSGTIYIDYNPSEHFWLHDVIYESLKYMKIGTDYEADEDNPLVENPRTGRESRLPTYEYIQSTYLDNIDFLADSTIAFIESLIDGDHFYEQVYVYGNMAEHRGKIYSGIQSCTPEFWDEELFHAETFYGCDVGFTHYMVLIEIKYHNECVYERVRYMKKNTYDSDLIEVMDDLGISHHDEIYVDSAAASTIKKMRDAGYNARKSDKTVLDGVRFCQSLTRYVCADGNEEVYMRQMNRYKWKQTADGEILEGTAVKIDDDGPDATRYGEYTHLKKRIHRLGVS